MFDNLAIVIGYLALFGVGIYFARYVISIVFPGMLQAWGIRGLLMMGFFLSGWAWVFYSMSHRYSSLEVVLPALVTTAIYIAWLSTLGPKEKP